MSNELETKTVEILDKLDVLTTKYTTEVVDSALAAVQVTAISNLVYAFVGVLATGLAWWLFTTLRTFLADKEASGELCTELEALTTVVSLVGVAFCVIYALVQTSTFFDTWNWVAIFRPELALAHQVLGL